MTAHPSPAPAAPHPPASQLRALARAVAGNPRESLTRLLVLVCEQLGMELALVSLFDDDGNRIVRLAVDAGGSELIEARDLSTPLAETWCGPMVENDGMRVGDVNDEPFLAALPITREFDIASYAGVVLRDEAGRPVGTLCSIGHRPHTSLNDRDLQTLRELAYVIAPLVVGLDRVAVPAQQPVADLSTLAGTVSSALSVQQLARPLLAALQEMTGLASTCLTAIHPEQELQEVRYALNTREDFTIPEGLHVPWADTLCKRALDEDRPCVTDVPAVWPDSEAAAALSVKVYVSVPVELADGRVWGTLCATDSQPAHEVEAHLSTMRLFARLIAAQVERDASLAVELERMHQARVEADLDALTGLAVRRVVEPWLTVNLAELQEHEVVLLMFADLDGFKPVNDKYGHLAGDGVLTAVGAQLSALGRAGDLVVRYGGDEFVLAVRLPRTAVGRARSRFSALPAVTVPWEGELLTVSLSRGFATSDDVGDAESLVAAADAAMYAAKRRRLAADVASVL